MTGRDREMSNGAPTPVTSGAWLVAHGRRSWLEILPLLADCTCLWADLDGIHAATPPAGPPLSTHLWAWESGRFLRIRVDGTDGIAAELRLSGPGQGEPVTVTERAAATWFAGDGRVSADDQWRGRAVRILEVTGLMPLEFVSLGNAPANSQRSSDDRAVGPADDREGLSG